MRAMRAVPLEQLTTSKDGLFLVYVDRWWVTSTDGNVFFFADERDRWASPQCNPNQQIAEAVLPAVQKFLPEASYIVQQVPVVYVPSSPNDWRDPYEGD